VQQDAIKVTNFFQSAGLEHKKFSNNKVSSVYFMAPERVLAEVDLNNETSMFKCDTWSIGVIIYLLFYGTMPFEG
jgi:serine/threonine protein kinase